ncbi:hypothetical protein RRG08_016031 [Elysia crispata]|uniref:Uncharacterized protein n=1 Tax=Elysia crispata TaxID=231223 RepID=A0AAE1B326_9GAST|nr:hypothetical protein RRG08_016031 [Elysia crispata]
MQTKEPKVRDQLLRKNANCQVLRWQGSRLLCAHGNGGMVASCQAQDGVCDFLINTIDQLLGCTTEPLPSIACWVIALILSLFGCK